MSAGNRAKAKLDYQDDALFPDEGWRHEIW